MGSKHVHTLEDATDLLCETLTQHGEITRRALQQARPDSIEAARYRILADACDKAAGLLRSAVIRAERVG
jgi:hypothetical protein